MCSNVNSTEYGACVGLLGARLDVMTTVLRTVLLLLLLFVFAAAVAVYKHCLSIQLHADYPFI